ncbi:hypothetical protein [Mycobacterium sp. M26]|uniref:hypothetical protein n=1 Tax=Mycobacterium sp. M26 TaxID=1762962 RepID=UPI000A3F3CFC|nr:hypothetical protein [Mycobacterium sp. M26]
MDRRPTVGGTTRLAAATMVGALAVAGFGSAPAANASCASFFSIGNNADCYSTPFSIAIAIGTGAQANAAGLFGAAFSVGDASAAGTGDPFTFAISAGYQTLSNANGLFGIAAALGPHTQALTEGGGSLGNLGFNIAVNLSPTNLASYRTQAGGVGNIAVNLFGTNNSLILRSVTSGGIANIAANVGGDQNTVNAGGGGTAALNVALQVLGDSNTVTSGPGPLAIAVSTLQTGQPVNKSEPGINVNGFKVPNTAAGVSRSRTAAPASASKTGGSKAVGHARSGRGSTER